MARRSLNLRFFDIQDSIAEISRLLAGVDFETYRHNWAMCRATERGIEIISEASRHIPDAMKDTEPTIPWREIADIGNVLRHAYQGVDASVIWNITLAHLPPLSSAIERLAERGSDL